VCKLCLCVVWLCVCVSCVCSAFVMFWWVFVRGCVFVRLCDFSAYGAFLFGVAVICVEFVRLVCVVVCVLQLLCCVCVCCVREMRVFVLCA